MGQEGCSISHFLIELITFVHYNQDLKSKYAVYFTLIDILTAFNKANHNIVLTKLHNMGMPGWLLKIVIGFLHNRTLNLKYKGESSNSKDMPGGTPAGTVLGLFLFIALSNDIGTKGTKQEWGTVLTKPLAYRRPVKYTPPKWVDDMIQGGSIHTIRDLVLTDPPVYI